MYQFLVATIELSQAQARDLVSDGAYSHAGRAGPDPLLRLDQAAWASEVLDAGSIPLFDLRHLRAAIRRGDLRPERHGHHVVLSRRHLQNGGNVAAQAKEAPSPWRHQARRALFLAS